MIKAIRRQLWFIKSFSQKYYRLIIGGIISAVFFFLIFSLLIKVFPQGKKTIYYGIVGQYNSNQLPQSIIQFVNSGLTSTDSHQQSIPQNASEWWMENDNKTYVFRLKQDIYWSDGEKVSLENIKINIPDVQIETESPDLIKFNLPAKFSPFPSILSFPLSSKKNLITSPYTIRVKQKTSGIVSDIVLESSQEKKIFKVFPNSTQAITAYKLGQIDSIIGLNQYTNSPLGLDSYGVISQNNNFKQIVLLMFSHQDPIFKSKPLRQAIAYGLSDKNFGFERAVTTFNPQSWAYNPLVKTYDFDSTKAQDLIKTNIGDQKMEIEISSLPELLNIAESIKDQLQNIGITATTKVVNANPGNFQLFLTTFSIPTDPDQYTLWHSTQSQNIGHQTDEKIDKSLEEGRTTFDQKERKRIYAEFQRVFAEELPALPLYYPKISNLARNKALSDIINSEFAL